MRSSLRTYSIAAALVLLTAAVFWQVRNHDFIPYDDDVYVYENPHLWQGLTVESIRWAFTTGRASNWHPLTWISLLADYERFGLNPSGFHLVNLFFHALNTVLLFVLLHRLTGSHWRSALVAALFALHPLHVESVAWIASRKDVLSTLFWFLTTLAYVGYVRQPSLPRYVLMASLFALGLMSKPMLVALPLTLLLLDFWPLGRFKSSGADEQAHQAQHRRFGSLVLEKVPLLVLSIVSSAMTYAVQQRGGAMSTFEGIPLGERIANAVVSYTVYIQKMFWPSDLAVFYPHAAEQLTFGQVGAAALVLVTMTVVAYRLRQSQPYFLTGWLWYLGTLVPVIGLVQVGAQSMADRYTYVPLIGLFIVIAWGIAEVAARWPRLKALVVALSISAVVGCGALTWKQLGYWRNGETLFRRTLEVTQDNWIAHNNLGTLLVKQGRYDEAEEHFGRAVSIYPQVSQLHNNLGFALSRQGKRDSAIVHLREAIRLAPNDENALLNLGSTLEEAGREDEALQLYEAVLSDYPDLHDLRYNYALLLARRGEREAAVKQFEMLLAQRPEDEAVRGEIEKLRVER